MQHKKLMRLGLLVLMTVMSLFSFASNSNPSQEFERLIRNKADSMNVLADMVLKGETVKGIPLYKAYFIKGMFKFNAFDFTTSEQFLLESLKAAKLENDLHFMGRINYRLGIINDRSGRFTAAFNNFRVLDSICEVQQDTTAKIISLNALGNIEKSRENFEASEKYFLEGLELVDTYGSEKLKWSLLYGIVGSLKQQHKYLEAYEYGYEALNLAETKKDTLDIAKSFLLLGVLSLENSQYDQSIEFLENALPYIQKKKFKYWKGLIHYNLSLSYLEKKESDKSRIHVLEALKIYKEANALPKVASSFNALAQTHLINDEYKEANRYADSALVYNGPEEKNYRYYESYCLKAEASLGLGDFQKTVEYGKYFDYEENEMNRALIIRTAKLMFHAYSKLGQYKEAHRFGAKVIELTNKDIEIQEARKITRIESEYKHNKEKQKIFEEQLRKDFESEKELASSKSQTRLMLLGLLFTFIVSFLLYRMYSIKRKDNSLLEQSNQEVKAQAKKLRELDTIKSSFFTNISHEFRTPLTLIKGPVEQLSKLDDSAIDKSLLKTIKRNTNRLLSLINQILELSELQSKQRVLKLSNIQFTNFFDRIVGSYESLADLRSIELTCTAVNKNASGWVEEESIEKIVNNLISNAFKFTSDQGKISLIFDCKEGWLEIRVLDTGIGIAETELEHIFEMFYHTESDQSASSGIGLALINELVKNHLGRISVKSKVKIGTEFIVSIPVDVAYYDQNNCEYTQLNTNKTARLLDNIEIDVDVIKNGVDEEIKKDADTVLVIEDNDEIRAFVVDILKDNFNVLEAENGAVGVELAQKSIPDLIVSDVMMPEKDGFEVAKSIRSDEKTSHIPIVLLTAKGDKESKLKGLSLEIDDYLLKPFDQDELLIRVHNRIKTRKQLQEKFSKELIQHPEKIDIPSIDQQFIDKVRTVIEERIDDQDLTVDELAKEVGVSRSQLHRKIVALSGKSTSVFIRNIRLRKAYLLIESKTANISEISDQVGFSSPSYFNKCFKELYNKTPRQVMSDEV